MPSFYGQIKQASLENLGSDPASTVTGRFWWNTGSVKMMIDDGTNKRALLRNDAYCVIGNNGTAASNIRLNRAAAAVLQFVIGSDATAEGSLSTSLAQISAKVENYTDSGKPAAGNAGRIIYVSDLTMFMGDNGASFVPFGGGGSGGGLSFVEGVTSPTLVQENNIEVYKYLSGGDECLYLAIKVPASYAAGRQIKLKTYWYSPDTSGTALISTLTTLIRPGTDLITSTTNQRTSSNVAVTMSAGTASIPQAVDLDLTSSIGQVNAVAVAAGSILIVKIFRGSDSGTSDLALMHLSCEVTLS